MQTSYQGQAQGRNSPTMRRPSEQSSNPDYSTVQSEASASSLYRAPTWAKNINFDGNFNLDQSQPNSTPAASGTRNSSFASPISMVGVALGGDSDFNGLSTSFDSRRPSAATSAARNSSGVEHSPFVSSHSRQGSGQMGAYGSPLNKQSNRQSILASSARLANHQRATSSSSLGATVPISASESARPSMPSQPHSSADLYAVASTQQESRPSTSMSMISGSGGEHSDSARNKDLKRASVLSFQTALSGMGGYASNDEANGAPELEHLDDAMPRRPWLQGADNYSRSGTSSYSSSPDDRLPGGWRGRAWLNEADTIRANSPGASNPAAGNRIGGGRTPSQSPRLLLSPLVDDSSRKRMSTTFGPSRSPTLPSKDLPLLTPESAYADSTIIQSPRNNKLLSPNTTQIGLMSPSSATSTIDAAQGISANAPTARSNETIAQPKRQNTFSTITPDVSENRSPTPLGDIAPDARPILDTSAAEMERMIDDTPPPTLPEKSSPPVPSKDTEKALSSPPLSDDIIPSPLPIKAAQPSQNVAMTPNALESTSPITDYRAKPLGRLPDSTDEALEKRQSQQEATQAVHQRKPSRDAAVSLTPIGAGVGAHNASRGRSDSNPAFAVLMRGEQNGIAANSAPRAALAEGPSAPPVEARAASPASIETPPREPSPPPEGEVEARAEWERAQMRKYSEQNKERTSRKSTFRGQLKPLQLVAAEEAKQNNRKSMASWSKPEQGSPALSATKAGQKAAVNGDRRLEGVQSPDLLNASPLQSANKTGEVLSTQQLQKMSARDSRLSTSMINMANGVTEVGGAYPVFASPNLSASVPGGAPGLRQYSGIMPQRSLVPPFELQNRPDGLPSALTGPDGIRRNPNDPDVCLECMMRDEDMIDVHVLGTGLWERESDREFDEACRIEAEDDSRKETSVHSHGGANDNLSANGNNGTESASQTVRRLTKIRVKKVAKGDPLTAERLKLHTQMNPPASSHRWRTLQTFLAVQAKYIAMDQRARGVQPAPLPLTHPKHPEYDNLMIRTSSNDSKRNQTSNLIKIDERAPMNAQERLQKEKDIQSAREARRRNAVSATESRNVLPAPPGSLSGLRAQTPTAGLESPVAEDDAMKRLSAPLLGNENGSNHSIPRRNNNLPAPPYGRMGSVQDLRSVPHATIKSPVMDVPPSPSSSLAPPSAPFRSSTPQAFGGHRGMRTTSSQLSLANSGISMIDMHVGTEDRKDHKLAQTGFLPGTPLHATSPSAFNRAYYGFPGDGDDTDQGSFRPAGDATMQSNELDNSQDYAEKKRKKGGLRGLFSKISGKDSFALESSQSSSILQPDGQRQQAAMMNNRNSQSPWTLPQQQEYQSPQMNQQMETLNNARSPSAFPTASTESANVASANGPPKRPPRNPSRGTSSQPPSENMQEVNSNQGSSMYTQTRAPYKDYPGPQPFTQSHQQQYLINGPTSGYGVNAQTFPSYEGGERAMHTRSSSAGGGLNAFTSEFGGDENEIMAGTRDRSVSSGPPTTQQSGKKTRLLKLPFGKNKRESVANSIASNKAAGTNGTPSLKSRSSRGTFDDVNTANLSSGMNGYSNNQVYGRPSSTLPNRGDYHDPSLNMPYGNYSDMDQAYPSPQPQAASSSGLKPWLRARRGSSNFDERNGSNTALPFRSQSALGMNDPMDDLEADGRSSSRLGNSSNTPKKGFLPRLRTSSRAALRAVDED
ncbi:uncharacterized protein FA14DRAFT_53088 [Meira miltonrushii]|uniref:Uncharacterized protein n=1 Tax=Meira miltonrushii TaxID=1280837 RepID=A0A316VFB7_9BASI|nr:uncharacterized protein FA14DRAFT_53088 [Meira miltonrushii]PWN36230.1 hypothetical protein FA14DRAFT_53088 [Meira miltonrushii]